MYFVRLEPEPGDYDEVVAALWEKGTAGIVEGHGYLDAFFEEEEVARMFGEPHPSPEIDWVRQTEDAWPPLLVGERFFVVAPWRTEPTPEGRIRLEINPGLQCGTGQHPCTRLCLEAMERAIRPGDSVLDVGSGDAVRSVSFDVVVANISEDVIGEMLPEFERVARTRILSGFQDERGEWTCVCTEAD